MATGCLDRWIRRDRDRSHVSETSSRTRGMDRTVKSDVRRGTDCRDVAPTWAAIPPRPCYKPLHGDGWRYLAGHIEETHRLSETRRILSPPECLISATGAALHPRRR